VALIRPRKKGVDKNLNPWYNKTIKRTANKKGEHKMYYIDSEETANILISLTEEELEELAADWD
jgi:hypothetical protein